MIEMIILVVERHSSHELVTDLTSTLDGRVPQGEHGARTK